MRSLRFLFKMRVYSSSYLKRIGYWKSVDKRKPMDADGKAVPWMCYPVIELLKNRLNKSLTLVEYGSGYSTAFFARLCRQVYSVEYDRKWYDLIRDGLPANAAIYLIELERKRDYVHFVDRYKDEADLVIVDGRHRVDCVAASAQAIRSSAVIILDDSDREKYQAAYRELAGKGYRYLEFEGLKPAKFESSKSTVFYRDGNVLGI